MWSLHRTLLLGIPFAIFFLLAKRKSKLYSIPGPFLASYTDLWRWYYQNFYRFTVVLADLHKRYGPIVRIGPNVVSFSDPSVVALIYEAHGEFKKADSYQTLRSAANGEIKGSIIDLQDETEVSIVKRAFGHIFAAKNVMDYEEDVNETRDVLLQSIRKTRTFDLFAMMSHFQADFLLNIAFGDQAHYLKTGADSNHLSFDARYQHWMKWQCMPYLESLLYKPPILMRYFKGAIPLWARMANEKLQARLTGKNANVRSDLLDKYIEGGEKRGDRLPIEAVPRMVSSTISAGFDTTAITMNSMIYYLCRNPSAMKKLRAEFAAANLSLLPDFHETQHLKYLDAVLKETLRLNPFLQVLFEREVPAGGAKLCGKYFPEGTVVGCHPTITHRDAFFGQDPNGFHPERWLIDDAGKLLEMERCSLWFGNGKRICLGRHLAEMEIKKVVPAMITGFDIELVDPNYILEPRDILTSFPKPVWVKFEERR